MSKSIPGVIREILSANNSTIELATIAAQISVIEELLTPKELLYASNTFSASSDTTVITIAGLPGYVAGNKIAVSYVIVQTTVDGDETFHFKNSGESPSFNQRVFAATKGQGFAGPVRWVLPPDTNLVINKTGTISSVYSITYHLE